jgi:hypothetical protein
MNSQRVTELFDAVMRAAACGLCPECGTPMAETCRSEEKNFIYVWYDCPRPHCGGQWLEKVNSSDLPISNIAGAGSESALLHAG